MTTESDYWSRFWKRRLTRRRMLRGALLGSAGLAMAGVIGCKGEEATEGTPAASGTPAELPRGGVVLASAGTEGNPFSLDPHKNVSPGDNRYIYPFCNGLLYFTADDWSPVPQLAVSLPEMPDPTTLIFKLRSGVKFHDGTDFDAEAARQNFVRFNSPDVGSLLAGGVPFDKWEAVDPTTLRMTLTQVYSPVIFMLMWRYGLMLSPASFARPDTQGAISCGPFKFKSYEVRTKLVVERFPDYFVPNFPYADEIDWIFFGDEATEFADLRTGGVHITSGNLNNAYYEQITSDKNFDGANVPGVVGRQLIFNTTNGVFKSKNLRQAVSLAIDRQALCDSVQFGGAPLTNPILSSSWAFNPNKNYYPYDPEEAKRLMAAEGVSEFSFVCPAVQGALAQLGEAIQAQLAEVGIKMDLQPAEAAAVIARILRGDFDVAFFNFDHTPDPDYYFSVGSIGADIAKFRERDIYIRHDHFEISDLVEKARLTLDQDERRQLYWQALDIIGGEMINVGVVQSPSRRAWTKKLKNVRVWADRAVHAEELAIET